MKLLFLDMDGVMNTIQHTDRWIEPHCEKELARILEATQANLVISSSWKTDERMKAFILSMLDRINFRHRYFGDTPDFWENNIPRHVEIKNFISVLGNVVDRFAILDDNDSACIPNSIDSFFLCDRDIGLTTKIADKVIEWLNNE